MSIATPEQLAAFAGAIGSVIGEIVGTTAEVQAGGEPPQRCWIARLAAADVPGHCVVAFDHEGAAALSRVTSPGDGEVEDVSIADVLRNAVAQATATLAVRPDGDRLELTLLALEPQAGGEPGVPGGEIWTIAGEGIPAPLTIQIGWADAAGSVIEPERAAEPESEQIGNRLDVILDIDLPVVVRFGYTELPIRTLTRIGPGSVIDLGRSPDDPVEILVSNRIVARGEVVIVGGNYGVRILEVASQSDRARSMEA